MVSCKAVVLVTNYHIAINFRGRKLSRIRRKREFHGENFHRLLETKHKWVWHAPNFMEKTFADGYQTSKFAKVSPSKVSRYTV